MAQKTLYQQLSEAIGVVDSNIVPDIFKMLADEKEARVLLAASQPDNVDEIVEKTGIAAGDVEKMMDPLFKKGLIFISSKPGETRYYRVRHILQFHDATILAEGVSQEFYDNSKKRLWAFKGMELINDHLNTKDHKEDGTSDHGIVKATFEYRPAK